MSHQLPLQVRKDIRDVFEKADSTVQGSLKYLAQVIGYPVSCEPEWHMLWTELESAYPDKAIFVPSIAKVIEAWSDSLVKRLEDDSFEAWTEVLLEKLSRVQKVKLSIQVADEARVKTSWVGDTSAFIITLPKKTSSQALSAAPSAFAEDLETLFEPAKYSDPVQSAQSHNDDDDWAELASNGDSMSLNIRTRPAEQPPQILKDLPSLQTLPRPEILFQTTLPFLMHVISHDTSKITVNGTHEPSLRLLGEYLQRWIKTDLQDVRKIPYWRITMHESKLGLGLFHDSLTIEPFDHHQRNAAVNVSLILAFIQGILGYHAVHGLSSSGYWEFQRSVPLNTS
ncbi:hypothetical protein A1O7_04442 [Cladophialophora yegresii CBS 114405]|uniref:Uncharacterized protein n=1 Tax=Cladophialophora yegresii CBS 114405 TaxID=1182544 RepID=W9W5K2_9EURO|nr:uncharacterized protein A1O7_04442 [Cladophialophora yegresii CBS 114405]EXJ60290.1 hypothetical protein A1O7_04442 [Cladophialophora yegresii CBS 114405]